MPCSSASRCPRSVASPACPSATRLGPSSANPASWIDISLSVHSRRPGSGVGRLPVLQLGHDASATLDVDPVEELVVDRHHRGVVARGQALGVLQRDGAVRGRLVVPDAEVLRERLEDVVAAEYLAHGVGADADQPVAGGPALVHRVEGGDRADLGPGDAQLLGAEGHPVRRDVPLLGLHQVQQRQQGGARRPTGYRAMISWRARTSSENSCRGCRRPPARRS